jgi:predicted flavoprotein YhiN
LIVATWGKSYPQVGATWFVYDVAKQFDIGYNPAYRCLCGMETVQNMAPVTWNVAEVYMQLWDWKKCIYDQKW